MRTTIRKVFQRGNGAAIQKRTTRTVEVGRRTRSSGVSAFGTIDSIRPSTMGSSSTPSPTSRQRTSFNIIYNKYDFRTLSTIQSSSDGISSVSEPPLLPCTFDLDEDDDGTWVACMFWTNALLALFFERGWEKVVGGPLFICVARCR